MTLKDVAIKANCSVSTVSKALKNSSEISEAAKERILNVAKECGYLKKAFTHNAVLGGFKTVIFNDINGDSSNLYFELQKLAKKQGLTLIYLSVREKDSLELLNQLGAFGVILKGDSVKAKGEKVFVLKNAAEEAVEFLKEIAAFMPQRPSRATSTGSRKTTTLNPVTNTLKKPKEKTEQKLQKEEPPVQKKEEIWLL